MRAEILSIGTELLIGQVVNTNATYLAAELASLGIDLFWVSVVGDNFERVAQALETAAKRSDLLLITGGLGPTPDDMTIEALSRFVGEPLVERAEVRAHIEDYFRRRDRPMAPSNLKMALFPPSAELIPNPAGTAFGVDLRAGSCRMMAFPGVPMEMRGMWEGWARSRLSSGATIVSALLKYVGIGESTLAEQVAPLLEGHNPTVAPYAKDAEVHLRVTAKAESAEQALALLAPILAQLQALAPYYFGRDEDTLPSVVARALVRARQSVAVAESCTGGLLASRLTDLAGSSAYFRGGVVAYATEVKAPVLGVSDALVAAHGVVSAEVATAMAQGVRQRLGADWALATTGYASGGPDVAEEEVGLVWLALAGPEGVESTAVRFGNKLPRTAVKFRATQAALDLLRRRLLELASPL